MSRLWGNFEFRDPTLLNSRIYSTSPSARNGGGSSSDDGNDEEDRGGGGMYGCGEPTGERGRLKITGPMVG